MSPESPEYYAACDKAIKAMNRQNVESFGMLKMAKWDEINVIQTVLSVYRTSAKRARNRYYEVAFEAYILMCAMCDVPNDKAHRMAEKSIDEVWVANVLSETDFVTMYRFDTETDRKAYRLAEALEVSTDRNSEIDKALRYWSQQLGQYAINVTDYAMIQAMMDAGVEVAQWVTMKDEKVCSECNHLDGQVFMVDEIPSKPHLGCRCRLRPILKAKKTD